MDDNLADRGSLVARVRQLESEREQLQKDIEQLCMQQAGPSLLGAATRMHFQRTAGLEQEIENLKMKLTACTREKHNLEEELSEAYRVKSQLADLHAAEAAKNLEAEKQLKFFQSSVAAAFAERDSSVMEAEKAKEREELMSHKLDEIENRLEKLTSDCLEQRKLNDSLHADLNKLAEQNRSFKKVIDKFYEIRQNSLDESEETSLDDKLSCLLHDPAETWTFNDPSTSNYVTALEGELEKMKSTMDNLQGKLRVGLEIENHLKKRVRELEKKNIVSCKLVMSCIEDLRNYHLQQRNHIMKLLEEGGFHFKSTTRMLEERLRQFDQARRQTLGPPKHDEKVDESECRDVHITTDVEPNLALKSEEPRSLEDVPDKSGNASEALEQALQEKVAALLLLSQQEERHLLERNVNATLQKRVEELRRSLIQVTNEKVKALMELARVKQEYQQIKAKTDDHTSEQENSEIGGKPLSIQERDGRLKNLLKKSYLKRWIGPSELSANEAGARMNKEEVIYGRLKIEHATLKESVASIEHLTSSIRRLRLTMLKLRESVDSEGEVPGLSEAINSIIMEANLLKTALGISIPISWSAESDAESTVESESSSEHIDSISAAGFEMVELVILAAELLKDCKSAKGS